MARPSKIVAIDIGSFSVKMAEFSTSKSGQITLSRYGVSEMGIDPNKEENALPFIANAIKKVAQESGIKGGEAHISFSSHTSFLKFIKIPPVEQAQLADILKFEAQQNVPFPLEEIVWDFQLLMGKKTEGDIDTVLAAIKNDQIESHSANLKKMGYTASSVDLSPLSLYNAFRYNYPESTDCALVLDIGARGTNLLFIEKNSFFTRSIPLAGNAITQSICNDLQEPYEVVEQLKKMKSYVSLGSEYAESTEESVARTAKIVRTTLAKLAQEISRSITFYRTQQKGSSPKTIYLTGGSSLLPYIDLFLKDKLSIPVEYFNPLKNVTLGKNVQSAKLSKEVLLLGELVGGGLSLLKERPIEINLSAASVRNEADQSRLKPMLLVALFAWVALFVAVNFGAYMQLAMVSEELDKRSKSALQLKEEEQKIIKLEQESDRYQKSLEALSKISRDRDAWKLILADLNAKIPKGVWITQLTPMFNDAKGNHELNEEILIEIKEGAVKSKKPKGKTKSVDAAPKVTFPPEINQFVVKGLYKSDQRATVINDFVSELVSSPYFEIDTAKLSDAIVSVENVSENNQSLALNFSLNLKLKTPIEVKP